MVSKADAVEQRERGVSEQRKPWFGQNAHSVAEAMESDAEGGLSRTEAAARLSRYGPNQIASEKPPSTWAVALQQLRDPLNVMLVAVVAVSLVIGEISTAVIVGLLVVLNIVLDARQELRSRAGVRRTASGRTRPCPLQHEPAVAMVPTGKEPNTLFRLG